MASVKAAELKFFKMKIKKNAVFKWSILILLVLLSLATLFALKYVDRFYDEKEQLLSDPNFLEGENHWAQAQPLGIVYSGKQLTITTTPGASNRVYQNVSVETPAYIRFSFDGSAKDIVAGKKDWARASGTIIYRNKKGDRIGSRMIATLDGSSLMKTYSHTELLREHIGSVDISFRLLDSHGTFNVRNPVFSVLQEYPFYLNLKTTIVVFWVLAFALLAFLALRVLSWLQVSVLVLLVVGILVGALMPEFLMSSINLKLANALPDSLLSAVRRILTGVYGIEKLAGPGAEVSKLGHFLAFSFIGWMVGFVSDRVGLVYGAACIGVFALLSEALQFLVGGRTPSVSDLSIDISGGLLGLIIGLLCLWMYGLFRHKTTMDSESHDDSIDRSPSDQHNY